MTAPYHEQDRRHLWHPYTRRSAIDAGPFPLITRAQGLYLHAEDGTRYLDAISSWWCCNLGHSHPRIVEAIQRQSARLQHSILGNLSHPRAIELAHRLAELMPDPARHVHFASDGASAVEAALKIALQYHHNTGAPERTRFVALRQAYHGDTLATLSLGFLPKFHRPFEHVRLPCLQVPAPPYDADPEMAFAQAEELFAEHGAEVAAMIVEPLCQGAAGMRIYAPGHVQKLFELCKAHGALFIADEIATGFGRTGSPFAFEQAGIDPDIICVGKALSAGALPISAAIVKDVIYDTFSDRPEDRTFYHGHTFAGNPIAAAAALAALDIYAEEDIAERAAKLGQVMASELEKLTSLDSVRDVRCLGLIGAVELAPEQAGPTASRTVASVPGEPGDRGASAARRDASPYPESQEGAGHNPSRAERVRKLLLEQGILIRPLGQVVYLMPPLVIPEETLRDLALRLGEAIAAAG